MKTNKRRQQNRISIILIIVALVLIIGCVVYFLCGKMDAGLKDNSDEEITAIDNPITSLEDEESEELDATKLNELEDLFNTNEYNGFLTYAFTNPSEINWDEVIFNGAGINKKNISQKEIDEFLKLTDSDELNTDLLAIDKNDLLTYMKEKAGVDRQDVNLFELDWIISDKYNCLYAEHGDTNFIPVECIKGVKNGSEITLDFKPTNDEGYGVLDVNPDRIITIEETDTGYRVKSMYINWEDGNNPDQTFDVELPLFEGKCRLITWDGNDEKNEDAKLLLTVDGNYECGDTLGTYDRIEENHVHIKTISSIGLFDYNADGRKDIEVIGKNWEGKDELALLKCESPYDGNYSFVLEAAESNMILAQIKGELTIPNLKAELLGDNKEGTFSNWKDAFKLVARLASSNDDLRFNLAYIDNDDVPELVVDKPGYNVSVYKFSNGIAQPVIEDWGYGVAGNHGYEYAPKKNCIRNYNSDYAGAIMYTSYISIHDDGEAVADYEVKTMNFKDLDGDGFPSDEELAASGADDWESNIEYSCDISVNSDDVTEAGIKEKIDTFESTYEFSELCGELTYEELLEKLK